MYLLLCGAVLMYTSVLLLIPQPTAQLCTANVWLYVLGFFLAFSAVFMKTYRYGPLPDSKARIAWSCLPSERKQTAEGTQGVDAVALANLHWR